MKTERDERKSRSVSVTGRSLRDRFALGKALTALDKADVTNSTSLFT